MLPLHKRIGSMPSRYSKKEHNFCSGIGFIFFLKYKQMNLLILIISRKSNMHTKCQKYNLSIDGKPSSINWNIKQLHQIDCLLIHLFFISVNNPWVPLVRSFKLILVFWVSNPQKKLNTSLSNYIDLECTLGNQWSRWGLWYCFCDENSTNINI